MVTLFFCSKLNVKRGSRVLTTVIHLSKQSLNIDKEIHIAFIENNIVKIYEHDEAVEILPNNIKNSDSWNIHGSYSWGKTPKIYDSIIRKI